MGAHLSQLEKCEKIAVETVFRHLSPSVSPLEFVCCVFKRLENSTDVKGLLLVNLKLGVDRGGLV
jgi:hypothetical protein